MTELFCLQLLQSLVERRICREALLKLLDLLLIGYIEGIILLCPLF